MIFYKQDLTLDENSINRVAQECDHAYTQTTGKRKPDGLDLAVALHNLLNRFQNTYGADTICKVSGEKRINCVEFSISTKGELKNPLSQADEKVLLPGLSYQKYRNAPEYDYDVKGQTNIVSFGANLKPVKNRMLYLTLGAVGLAILTFFLLQVVIGNNYQYIKDSLVGPIFTKGITIITEIATPLVFLAVINGIIGLGRASSVSAIGKKMLKNSLITYLFTAVFFSIVAAFFFTVSITKNATGQDALQSLITLVLDMIPDNLVLCFLEDNTMQCIVLAIFIGFILLGLGKTVEKVTLALDTLSVIVNKMMEVVCRLLPLIVYLGVLNMLLTQIPGIGEIYKVFVVWFLSCIAITFFLWIRTIKWTSASPIKLFPAQLNTLIINLTTSSQVAALPENIRCCKEKFGIDSKFIDFIMPICIVTYMPSGAAFLGLTAWGIAAISGTVINLTVIIKIAIIAIILAIAAPPIPGSAFAVMPILFSACGIDLAYYSTAVILGTVIGYFLPALNGYFMQLELLLTAKQANLVDEEKLGVYLRQSKS